LRPRWRQRYAHAHQFKRANWSLRKLKTYRGRVIREIERRIVGNEGLREAFVGWQNSGAAFIMPALAPARRRCRNWHQSVRSRGGVMRLPLEAINRLLPGAP
jgi:hypothetical protein